MKIPSHVLRLMCHWQYWSLIVLLSLIAPGSTQAQRLQALVNQSTIDWPLYSECKSTCTWKACAKNRQENKNNINLLSIVVFHLTWKVSREARFWLTSGQTASIQGHWQTKSSWIAFSIARALYAPPDEIWDESLCQHKSPAKPDLGRQHTYTPSTCHSEDADSPVLHVLFSGLLFTFASWTWGGVDGCGHATNLYKTRSGLAKLRTL